MLPLSAWIQFAGAVQLATALANLPLAWRLHRSLGRFLSAFLAIFWLLRVPIQLFYYPTDIRRQNRLADVVFTVAFVFLAVVLGLAATR